jgi:hypothetical protein
MPDSAQTNPATSSHARRPGPSQYRARGPRSWSPLAPGSSHDPDEDRHWLEREMSLLQRALNDQGEMRRRDLGNLVGCKYWGPQRFSRALKTAVQQGRIEHRGFGRYGPAS